MEEKKISVNDLYNHIIKFMTPEVALKKLLSSSLIQYEKLKFDNDGQPVHPLIIISMASMDLGWGFVVTEEPEVQGLVVGTQEYIGRIFPKENPENSK